MAKRNYSQRLNAVNYTRIPLDEYKELEIIRRRNKALMLKGIGQANMSDDLERAFQWNRASRDIRAVVRELASIPKPDPSHEEFRKVVSAYGKVPAWMIAARNPAQCRDYKHPTFVKAYRRWCKGEKQITSK